jgi:heme exporter protein A
VDLALAPGDCLALFGPNGAGKTTLLRMIAGLLKPTAGTVLVGGQPVRGEESAYGTVARGTVGLISHQSMLYGALTARENVEFAARLYGMANPRAAAAQALEHIRIADRADMRVRSLSRGMQQRVSIARSTVHGPAVVLLDEPYTGLDAAGGAALTDMLQSLRSRGAALVLVTHNVEEGLAIASHAAIMTNGQIVQRDDCATLDPRAYQAAYRSIVLGEQSPASIVAAA